LAAKNKDVFLIFSDGAENYEEGINYLLGGYSNF
jgi:hypothetical protein